MKRSQSDQILAWLKRGRTITPLQALDKFGCFRLGARIYNLRQDGYNITKKFVKVNGKTFAKYKLQIAS